MHLVGAPSLGARYVTLPIFGVFLEQTVDLSFTATPAPVHPTIVELT